MGFMTWDKGKTKRAGLVFPSALYRLAQMSRDTKEKAVANLIQYTKARGLVREESSPRICLLAPTALDDS